MNTQTCPTSSPTLDTSVPISELCHYTFRGTPNEKSQDLTKTFCKHSNFVIVALISLLLNAPMDRNLLVYIYHSLTQNFHRYNIKQKQHLRKLCINQVLISGQQPAYTQSGSSTGLLLIILCHQQLAIFYTLTHILLSWQTLRSYGERVKVHPTHYSIGSYYVSWFCCEWIQPLWKTSMQNILNEH